MNIIKKGEEWVCVREPKYWELILFFWTYPYPFYYKREYIIDLEKNKRYRKIYLDELKEIK